MVRGSSNEERNVRHSVHIPDIDCACKINVCRAVHKEHPLCLGASYNIAAP